MLKTHELVSKGLVLISGMGSYTEIRTLGMWRVGEKISLGGDWDQSLASMKSLRLLV